MGYRPIYDVSKGGYGTGLDFYDWEPAQAHAEIHGGTVMVSYNGGRTWESWSAA